MRVTKPQLAQILNGGLRDLILPDNHQPPEGRHRLHRRGGPTVCHIEIVAAHHLPAIGDHVTPVDARRNGYQRLDDYRDDWCRTHDAAWTSTPGWLITLHVVPHPDRVNLLARQNGKRQPAQYTASVASALADEPEAVPAHIVERLPSTVEATQRHALVVAELEAAEFTGSIGERLDRALDEARRTGVDASAIERLAARKIADLERRARRAA